MARERPPSRTFSAALVDPPGQPPGASFPYIARAWRLALGGTGDTSAQPPGMAVRPRDLRPADPARGERWLRGDARLGGETMDLGAGDPWTRPTPSRRFAAALHGFDWARDLASHSDEGARALLALWLGWRRVFGSGNAFAWSGAPLERRVFNLACTAPALLPLASEAEGADLLDSLAKQARKLLAEAGDPGRTTERSAVGALVGAALPGKAGERLLAQALPRLAQRLPETVLRDGVHASRSPQRGLDLLFDLLTLDDALAQRGAPPEDELSRAIDRLSAGIRFFALADKRLAAFQGGEPGSPERLATALAIDGAPTAAGKYLPYGGFHRLEGGGLQLVVDAGAWAGADHAASACAQIGALEVVCDGHRVIAGAGWSEQAVVGGLLRGPDGASCLGLAGAWPGASLKVTDVGERLLGRAPEVRAERMEDNQAIWIDLEHAGWRGWTCQRRLWVEAQTGELRGEDSLQRVGRGRAAPPDPVVRFHLAPDVAAQLAADGRSCLLRLPGKQGWRLRADAGSTTLTPSAVFEDGEPRITQVLALAGFTEANGVLRVRWKLSRDDA